MRVNKFLFPLVVLTVFLLVVGGAMILGFWQTKGGRSQNPAGGRGGGHEDGALPAIETIAQASSGWWLEEVTR